MAWPERFRNKKEEPLGVFRMHEEEFERFLKFNGPQRSDWVNSNRIDFFEQGQNFVHITIIDDGGKEVSTKDVHINLFDGRECGWGKEYKKDNKEINIDPKALKEIREKFAEELEKRVSQSMAWRQTLGEDIGERVICEEKVLRNFGTENMVVDLGRKFGLSEEQINELKEQLLKKKST